MKSSPQQMFREAETMKTTLGMQDFPLSKESCSKRRKLGQLLELILLTDLDYALDKKVEQDLWNIVYRNPITALQSKSKDSKNSSQNQQCQLALMLEAASGFYLQLLQKLACSNDIDTLFHPRDSSFGLAPEWKCLSKANKSSVMYICQHCMVHLGDIARYRGQSLQAETFYRHAIDLIPSNGQPYNQLAILEAASGEKLSTVFFYVRSLSVQHPFPLAATNLNILYCKMSSDGGNFDSKARMSAYEYISAFLHFHSLVHLGTDFEKAEKVLCQLSSSLPALIIAEKLESWKLIQMVTICMFTLGHAWNHFGGEVKNNLLLLSTPGGEEQNKNGNDLSTDETQTVALTLDLIVSILNAFLLPIDAILDLKESQDYFTIPAVKVLMEWIVHHHKTNAILKEEAFAKRPQIWQGLCKLLNVLDIDDFNWNSSMDSVPLPEDWDLQCFLPLQNAHRYLQFQNQDSLSEEQACRLRAIRLKSLVSELAQLDVSGTRLLSISENVENADNVRFHYCATYEVPVLQDQVLLQQIKDQLAISNPNPPPPPPPLSLFTNEEQQPIKDGIHLSQELIQKCSMDCVVVVAPPPPPPPLIQEVRFKLDDHEDNKRTSSSYQDQEESSRNYLDFRSPPPPSSSSVNPPSSDNPLLGNRERKAVRQNVALQAILQQRALNYGRLQEPTNVMNTTGDMKDSTWINSTYNQQNPSVVLSGVPPAHFLVPPRDPHSSSKSLELSYHPQQRPPPPPPHLQTLINPLGMQQQQQHLSSLGLNGQQQNQSSSNYMSNPRMMWNYNMAPTYSSSSSSGGVGPSPKPSIAPSHPLMQQPPPPQQKQVAAMFHQQEQSKSGGPSIPPPPLPVRPSSYMLEGGGHRDANMMQSLLGNPTPNNMSSNYHHQMALHHNNRPPPGIKQNEHIQYRYANIQSMEDVQRNHFANHLPYNASGVGGGGGVGLSSTHLQGNHPHPGTNDVGANTYSLFNSPWSSGLTTSRNANKEGTHATQHATGHNNVESLLMQHKTQSLWSGNGPSPLERLLEQQKQRRDASNP